MNPSSPSSFNFPPQHGITVIKPQPVSFMSPLIVRMLMWFYIIQESWPEPSDAADDAIEKMLDRGLIRPVNGSNGAFKTTLYGDRFIYKILSTDLP